MGRCVRCGQQVASRVCTSCMKKFEERRAAAFALAEEKHGKLCASNLKLIQAEVKQQEKLMKKQERKG